MKGKLIIVSLLPSSLGEALRIHLPHSAHSDNSYCRLLVLRSSRCNIRTNDHHFCVGVRLVAEDVAVAAGKRRYLRDL
jgi:hypothetical protein